MTETDNWSLFDRFSVWLAQKSHFVRESYNNGQAICAFLACSYWTQSYRKMSCFVLFNTTQTIKLQLKLKKIGFVLPCFTSVCCDSTSLLFSVQQADEIEQACIHQGFCSVSYHTCISHIYRCNLRNAYICGREKQLWTINKYNEPAQRRKTTTQQTNSQTEMLTDFLT